MLLNADENQTKKINSSYIYKKTKNVFFETREFD